MFVLSKKNKKFICGLIVFFSVIFWVSFKQIPDDKFHLYFLDVGQGDGILIKTPENHQIIIDGGPGNALGEEISNILPFWDRKIDLIVLTHPDSDHLNGFLELIKRYKIENALITGVNKKNENYDRFLELLIKQKTRMFFADAKTDFKFGEVIMDIIYPFDQIITEDFKKINNSSIIMKIIYQDNEILLSGDADEEIEQKILDENLSADIFKAGHHGSKLSSSTEFLEKIKPGIVVIQVGKNSYGHPTEKALERFEQIGAKVYRNDEDGRVEFMF